MAVSGMRLSWVSKPPDLRGQVGGPAPGFLRRIGAGHVARDEESIAKLARIGWHVTGVADDPPDVVGNVTLAVLNGTHHHTAHGEYNGCRAARINAAAQWQEES